MQIMKILVNILPALLLLLLAVSTRINGELTTITTTDQSVHTTGMTGHSTQASETTTTGQPREATVGSAVHQVSEFVRWKERVRSMVRKF